MIHFSLDTLRQHQQQVQHRLATVREEMVLNERQQAILGFLREHSPVAIRQLDQTLHHPRPTLKADLARLLELGLIQRHGAGRGTRYAATPQ